MTIFGLTFASLGLLTASLGHFYAAFFVLGAVGNGTTQLGYSRPVSTWFDERRGLALALVMGGVGTGAMVFPPVAQALIDAHGWRITYGWLARRLGFVGLASANGASGVNCAPSAARSSAALVLRRNRRAVHIRGLDVSVRLTPKSQRLDGSSHCKEPDRGCKRKLQVDLAAAPKLGIRLRRRNLGLSWDKESTTIRRPNRGGPCRA